MTVDEQAFRKIVQTIVDTSETRIKADVTQNIKASEVRLKRDLKHELKTELRAEFREDLAQAFAASEKRLEDKLSRKIEHEVAIAIEHFDGKFDSLAEATSAVIDILKTKASTSDVLELNNHLQLVRQAVAANSKDTRQRRRKLRATPQPAA